MRSGPDVVEASVDDLETELETRRPLQLIDVRELDEFESGHVAGALHIPLGFIAARAPELEPGRRTYVICELGFRSAEAARLLVEAGFVDVRNVKGGTAAWRSGGRPLE